LIRENIGRWGDLGLSKRKRKINQSAKVRPSDRLLTCLEIMDHNGPYQTLGLVGLSGDCSNTLYNIAKSYEK